MHSNSTQRAIDFIHDHGSLAGKSQLEQWCRESLDDPELRALWAECLISSGDYEGADAVLLGTGQPSAAILTVRSSLFRRLGSENQADELLSEARALNPDDYFLLTVGYANALSDADFDQAEEFRSRCEALFPCPRKAHSRKASIFAHSGDLDGCFKFLEDSPDWFKATSGYQWQRGWLARQLDDVSEAEHRFRLALDLQPTKAMTWALLSSVTLIQGNYAETARAANKCLELNSRNPVALKNLARVAAAHGDKRSERDFLSRAEAAIPVIKGIREGFEAGEQLIEGDIARAIALQRVAIEKTSPGPRKAALRTLLKTLISVRQLDEARSLFDELEAAGDKHPAMRLARVQFLLLEGKGVEAAELAKEYLGNPVQMVDMVPVALNCFLSQKMISDAASIIETIVTDPVANPRAVGSCVVILNRFGRQSEASRVLSAGRRRYPGAVNLSKLAAEDALRRGDRKRAVEIYEEIPRNRRGPSLWKVLWKRILTRIKKGRR